MTKIFTNVKAKWPGSVHDLIIFRDSHLCILFESGKESSTIKNQAHCITYTYADPNTYFFLGDYDTFLPADRCFMTPFPDPNQLQCSSSQDKGTQWNELWLTKGKISVSEKSEGCTPDRAWHCCMCHITQHCQKNKHFSLNV